MDSWKIGDVKVTRVIEIETASIGKFVLPDATPEAIQERAWLRPHFADADGNLIMSIHAHGNALQDLQIAKGLVDLLDRDHGLIGRPTGVGGGIVHGKTPLIHDREALLQLDRPARDGIGVNEVDDQQERVENRDQFRPVAFRV